MDARADSPGNCGNEALWWIEFCVEVEDGREIGSMPGSDCRPSSECVVLNDGSSRACCSLDEGRRGSMGEARYGASVDAVVAVGRGIN